MPLLLISMALSVVIYEGGSLAPLFRRSHTTGRDGHRCIAIDAERLPRHRIMMPCPVGTLRIIAPCARAKVSNAAFWAACVAQP